MANLAALALILFFVNLQQRLAAQTPPPFELKWGTIGSGNGEFDDPRGVAVDRGCPKNPNFAN